MRVLGIIAEYNPFHNGHLYHLQKSIEVTGATHTVAIMSGSFLQRGEPSLIGKWSRAEMAVKSGVDLVIELPVVYSCRSAEAFACGAVSILEKSGAVDCICFGSESGDLRQLELASEILFNEPEAFRKQLIYHLDKGLSFPAARSKALENFIEGTPVDVQRLMLNPNNILAVEYLKALRKFNSSIVPYTVKRIAAHYSSTSIESTIASATAIRKELLEMGKITDRLTLAVPQSTYGVLERDLSMGKGPVTEKSFSSLLIGQIRKSSVEELRKYPEISEGLEYKIWQAARKNSCISKLLSDVKSKRYTLTRLKRILVYIMLDIHNSLLSGTEVEEYPGYVRVLALNKKGREILRRINSASQMPVITKTANHNISEGTLLYRMLEKDFLATDIYVLGYSNGKFAFAGQDFVSSPIYLP